jgi:mannose-1-phosphate guanylyltransferase
MEKSVNRFAVIMAGGVGSRFWPVSKQSYPKQFHDLLGTGKSLLQTTYDRFKNHIPVENILILTNADYVGLVKEQLPDMQPANIVAEPALRNTAPCILLAALKIKKINPDATMVIAPSDSYIANESMYLDDLKTGFNFCEKNREALLTMGVTPTSPQTGYGYIEFLNSNDLVKKVAQFREKPSLKKAQEYLASGNFLWNAGLFLWTVDAVVSAFAKAEPELLHLFQRGMEFYNEPKEQDFLEKHYEEAKNISIDYAIMERSKKVYVLPTSFGWNDLGSWSTLYQQLDKNADGNVVIQGDVNVTDASGNIIRTQDHKRVFIQGLENYIIVEQDDVLMILPMNADQTIKEIRSNAMDKYGTSIG